MSKAVLMPAEREPGLKVFSQVNNNIQVLEDYRGVLSDEYWDSWARNPYREEKGSFRDQNELRKVAEEMKYSEMRDRWSRHRWCQLSQLINKRCKQTNKGFYVSEET